MNLDSYTDNQRAAVTHGEGPLLVNSGAGSGKTRVITGRVQHLIESGVEPSSIFVGTFTKKASEEFQARLRNAIGDDAVDSLGHVGTLHSFGWRVLKDFYALNGNKCILEPWATKRLMEDLASPRSNKNHLGLGLPDDVFKGIRKIIGTIDLLKANLITPSMYAADPASDTYTAQLYTAYEQCKAKGIVNYDETRQHRVVDFGDMLCQVYYILTENPGVLARYQAQFKYVLVDEGQDNNQAQYAITRLIASPEYNLTLVGDDYQSIYAFRGAKPSEFVAFGTETPNITVVNLDTNFRSVEPIVEMGNRLIANNTVQMHKTVKAHRQAGDFEPMYNVYTDEREEGDLIVAEIKNLIASGSLPGDIAVIYRTNRQSRSVEDALVKAGVDYIIVGSAGFYRRAEVRTILGYIQVAAGYDADFKALGQIINKPTRYLGAAFVRDVTYTREAQIWTRIRLAAKKPYQQKGAYPLAKLLEELHGMIEAGTDIGEIIRYAVEQSGLDKWLDQQLVASDADAAAESGIVDEVIAAASSFETVEDFLVHVKKQQSATPNDKPDPEKVTLITGHRAKGLEWKNVFVIGVSAGLVPHAFSVTPEEIEEERRWLYVALTRAMDRLYVSSTMYYNLKPAGPSSFVGELMIRGLDSQTPVEVF